MDKEDQKMRGKDSLDYLFSLTPVIIKIYGFEASLPNAIREYISGDWAEFGVGGFNSARLLMKKLPQKCTLHLFDSFEGLPEDWLVGDNKVFKDYNKGRFKMDNTLSRGVHRLSKVASELPVPGLLLDPIPDKVFLHVGLFGLTVPQFVLGHRRHPLGLIHVDCDIFSSTKDVLFNLNDLIAPGTIIVFDEFYNYDVERYGFLLHEYKALWEWVDTFGRSFEYLGRTNGWQAWVKVTK